MKIICECGIEGRINCPPEFGETMKFALGHRHDAPAPPRTLKAVCACGAEREIGPGAANWIPGTQANVFLKGMSDGQWFGKHATCEAS
jgi:hypothetical protein